MKTFIATLAFAALALQPAVADWVIVQKSSTDGQNQESTIKIKGEKARMDMAEQVSVILPGDNSGSVILLLHPQKAIMKMSAETIAMGSKMLGGLAQGAAPKLTATGQTEKVGEYNTEIYTWTGSASNGKSWVAKDFPRAKELNEIQDKLTKAMGNPMSALLPAASDVPGMSVKSEMTIMGKTVTSELVSAKEEPVDDATFNLPTDYQEMKMPALPTAPAGPAGK